MVLSAEVAAHLRLVRAVGAALRVAPCDERSSCAAAPRMSPRSYSSGLGRAPGRPRLVLNRGHVWDRFLWLQGAPLLLNNCVVPVQPVKALVRRDRRGVLLLTHDRTSALVVVALQADVRRRHRPLPGDARQEPRPAQDDAPALPDDVLSGAAAAATVLRVLTSFASLAANAT